MAREATRSRSRPFPRRSETESHEGRRYAPFITTKAHGLGIGLTIVQSIVHAARAPSPPANNPGRRLRTPIIVTTSTHEMVV